MNNSRIARFGAALFVSAAVAVPAINVATQAAGGAWTFGSGSGSAKCTAPHEVTVSAEQFNNEPADRADLEMDMSATFNGQPMSPAVAVVPGQQSGTFTLKVATDDKGNFAGGTVHTIATWHDGRDDSADSPEDIVIGPVSGCTIPTSATGSVNQSACNTSSDVETWTVAFDVTGEPDASADVTYNWTAEGHNYDGTLGNFGIGSHTAEIDTPDWATPGMQLMLTVDYTIAGNESKPGLIAQINPVKGTCKVSPPPDEPTDVSNPPVVVTASPAPAKCTEEEVKAGKCLAFTDRTFLGLTLGEIAAYGFTFVALTGGPIVWFSSRRRRWNQAKA